MGDEYAKGLTNQAVARACLALGIKTAAPNVVHCLSDVTKLYIQTIAQAAVDQAELGGRSAPGIQDVLAALTATKPRVSNWRDLKEFAAPTGNRAGWKQPFPHSIQPFPEKAGAKQEKRPLSEPSQQLAYIPSHLPPLPPSHTYKRARAVASAVPAATSAAGLLASTAASRKSLKPTVTFDDAATESK